MKFSFMSVVVSKYPGVVYIDVFTLYLVFSLLHKLYPFLFCIVMFNYVSSALYSPIHYSIVFPFFFPDAYLASQARRLAISWGSSFPQLVDHFGCMRSTHAREGGLGACPQEIFDFLRVLLVSSVILTYNRTVYSHVAT